MAGRAMESAPSVGEVISEASSTEGVGIAKAKVNSKSPKARNLLKVSMFASKT